METNPRDPGLTTLTLAGLRPEGVVPDIWAAGLSPYRAGFSRSRSDHSTSLALSQLKVNASNFKASANADGAGVCREKTWFLRGTERKPIRRKEITLIHK